MTFVSYAQNFEDLMLWRALGSVSKGFYIDVGAWSPDLDSVTRAFSDAGWRGINIEPNPLYFAQLVARRPKDVNLSLAIGDREGSVVMNFIADSGLSTADEAIARRHAAAGWQMSTKDVQLTTLASVWRAHVPPKQPVHFLKVDVEGFERAVLAGNDWSRNRAWIVVVEATLPNSQTESHEDWEDILLGAGYAHVYSDGLNRFYLADEHGELKSAFRYPPNVFDGMVPAELHEARQRLKKIAAEGAAAGERATSDAQWRIAALERDLAEGRRRIELAEAGAMSARLRERRASAKASIELNRLRQALLAKDEVIGEADHRAALLLQEQQGVLASTSWRLTAPARKLVSLVPRPMVSQVRRLAKGAWWALTPWRMPQRLRFIRQRSAASLSLDDALWIEQPVRSIDDRWSAARWCLDLLRSRPDLRGRFPKALSDGGRGEFVQWLRSEGATEFKLDADTLGFICKVLGEDIGARSRQIYMFRADVREGLPHGLTPPGQRALFQWFVQYGRLENDLRWEEIAWFFAEASENPALELVRAYLFTPAWQARHPDGLTVFGRRAFGRWFSITYGVDAEWTDPSQWPLALSLARQVRQAYHARSEWRLSHPAAFDSAENAMALLTWALAPEAQPGEDAVAAFAGADMKAIADELVADGVNVIGHFSHPSGVRVSAEALVGGLGRQGVPTSLRDIRTDIRDDPDHVRFDGLEDFGVTIIHTQPEPYFSSAYERCDLLARSPRPYRIAYWYWEFDAIPHSWAEHAAEIDEVWAATEFVAKGLRERLALPVRTVFPGVQLGRYRQRDRSHFGLKPGYYTFLFNFHMNSVMERKNPLGLIRAFKAAFGVQERVALVIKTMFGDRHPQQMEELRLAAQGANITIVNEVYTPDEVLSLMDACDAYVSLHRSEGLGLTMAEAMLMGKPVIATNYSGNIDFMNEDNSLLVPYELVTLGRVIHPYEAHYQWAEPSLTRASELMRRVFDHQDWAREVGARGQASARISLSLETAGRKAAARLAEIRASLRGRAQEPADRGALLRIS